MQPPRLLAISPAGSKPREYPLLKEESIVGSDERNALVMPDRGVSRCHAVIRRRAGRYELADLNSTNGTFINGERVRAAVVLKMKARRRLKARVWAPEPGADALRGSRLRWLWSSLRPASRRRNM
jgi:hypothetical protein